MDRNSDLNYRGVLAGGGQRGFGTLETLVREYCNGRLKYGGFLFCFRMSVYCIIRSRVRKYSISRLIYD